MPPKQIGIVGSANMDLVVRTERMPGPGENVFGAEFHTIPGGKGANQAVAVARLGAHALFVGKVGNDAFGAALLENLNRERVNTSHVLVDPDAPSGTALIVVDADGQNRIIVCPGANGRLTSGDMGAAADRLSSLDAIVMQLEIPRETIVHTIRRARENHVPVILDAGPPRTDPPDEFFQVAILTPNEPEAEALTGIRITNIKSAQAAARQMLERGAAAVVLKLGDKGALLASPDEVMHLEAHKVDAVDTTAAGDAFTAALAVYTAEGMPLAEAVKMANRAGALAVTKLGAQPSMPTRADVEAFRTW